MDNRWLLLIGGIILIIMIMQTNKIGTEAVGDLLPGSVYTIDFLKLTSSSGTKQAEISGTGPSSTSDIYLKFKGGGGQMITIDSTGHYSHKVQGTQPYIPDGASITFGNIPIGIVNFAYGTQTLNTFVCQNGACAASGCTPSRPLNTCGNDNCGGYYNNCNSGYSPCQFGVCVLVSCPSQKSSSMNAINSWVANPISANRNNALNSIQTWATSC